MKFMWVSLFIISLVSIPFAWSSPAEEPENDSIPILESTQQLFGGQANGVANRLDLFFADQRADDELARSRLRIRQTYIVKERALPQKETQFRLNLKLPSLEEKFRFSWFQDDKDKKKKKQDAADAKKPDVTTKKLNTSWQFNSSVGFSASIPPKVNWSNRLRKNFESGDVIHRFVEEINWFSDRDWEQNTTLDSDLSLADNILLRFRNATDWKITRKDFSTSHGPLLFHRVTEHDAFSYNLTLSTIIDSSVWFVNNYQAGVTYRRNLYHQWLYLDVKPGLDFPKEWSFRRTPFIFTQLEILFGQ